MKRLLSVILGMLLVLTMGCNVFASGDPLADGTYSAAFESDSSMFHINEAYEGRGTLTVKDGQMTIHITLVSKNITNLFLGTAEDAQKEGAAILEPTTDSVTYSDGYTEDVYGFDVPVEAIDEEFDLALLGKKGNWYDHKVVVSDPQPAEETAEKNAKDDTSDVNLEDGSYQINVTLEGGSGRATIESPAKVTIEDGQMIASIVWSSPNYDYMVIDGEKYLPVSEAGENSCFEIPVIALDQPIEVVADTVAMSTPHEIEYTITFESADATKGE